MVITAVAPMVAPMTGGAILLLPFATWHTILYSIIDRIVPSARYLNEID